MPYYQGDYYQGDYYAGDPFFGGLFRAISGVAKGVLGLGGGTKTIVKAAPAVLPGGTMTRIGQVAGRVGSIIMKHPVLSAAGAAGTIGILGGGGAAAALHMGGRRARHAPPGTKGYHPSKRDPNVWVRNRRMNVCNPRALRRGLRRAHGFAKLAMRTIHLVHPKKKGRFGGFRRRRAK
jgi:hypothetical protein